MKVYLSILDETVEHLHNIGSSKSENKKSVEIAKLLGFNYTCDLNQKYKYKDKVDQSVEDFKIMAKYLFDYFGTLIDGIVSNVLAQGMELNINSQNARFITKGLMVQRLLTTYKLKDYIIKKLKVARISPSITLGEYYHLKKRKVFLNFSVIDVNR